MRYAEGEIESVFNLFDTDGSGRIDEGECVFGLKALGFEKVTKDDLEEIMGPKPGGGGARTVGYADFKERVLKCTKMSHVKEVEGVFKMFDSDRTGAVGLENMREVSTFVKGGEPAHEQELKSIIRAVSDGCTEIYYSDWAKAVGQQGVEYPMGSAVARPKVEAAHTSAHATTNRSGGRSSSERKHPPGSQRTASGSADRRSARTASTSANAADRKPAPATRTGSSDKKSAPSTRTPSGSTERRPAPATRKASGSAEQRRGPTAGGGSSGARPRPAAPASRTKPPPSVAF